MIKRRLFSNGRRFFVAALLIPDAREGYQPTGGSADARHQW
jgi:hypothetical protein